MRVQQQADFLTDHVRMAMAGRSVPAAFQREYAWTRRDVEALWTSLLEGWPIGSLLLWEPSRDTDRERLSRGRIGPREPEVGEWDTLILDGQNRLATMAWSSLLPGEPRPASEFLSEVEARTWAMDAALVCDFETRSVRFVPASEADHGLRIPTGALLDSRAFNSAAQSMLNKGLEDKVFDQALRWFDDCANSLRNARIAVTVLQRATPAEAVKAFRHIARTGQPVTPEEVEKALTWLEDSPAPRP